jgi:hypothetical protein
MAIQKFMGKHQLIDRLAAQVGSKASAIKILQQRGHLKADGKTLTQAGEARDNMTAEERAKDRAAKKTGKPATAFTYNPKTNAALRK